MLLQSFFYPPISCSIYPSILLLCYLSTNFPFVLICTNPLSFCINPLYFVLIHSPFVLFCKSTLLCTKKLKGTVLGTVAYMAPEIFQSKRYDESVDIWSLGVVALQIVQCKPQKEIPESLRIEIAKNKDYISQLLKDNQHHPKLVPFCESCLRLDPTERPKAEELLAYLKV